MEKLWPFLTLVPVIFLGTYMAYSISPLDAEVSSKDPLIVTNDPDKMEQAVDALLSSLDAKQLESAKFPFDHDERYNFNYVPIARKGLALKHLNPSQTGLVMDVLRTAMSPDGIYRIDSIELGREMLEGNVMLVFFPGGPAKKPWEYEVISEHPWISQYYPFHKL